MKWPIKKYMLWFLHNLELNLLILPTNYSSFQHLLRFFDFFHSIVLLSNLGNKRFLFAHLAWNVKTIFSVICTIDAPSLLVCIFNVPLLVALTVDSLQFMDNSNTNISEYWNKSHFFSEIYYFICFVSRIIYNFYLNMKTNWWNDFSNIPKYFVCS